jgi:IS605 OrfB family transposase
MDVRLMLPVKLVPTPEQHAALLATVERFNVACDWLGGIVFAERCANKVALQKLAYYDVRSRFGLAAQLSIRAISKTVEAYKRDKTIRPRFRPHGAVPYDERIMSWKGVEHVSLLTLEGRVLIPTVLAPYQVARLDRRRGQADLVYRDGTFYLYVTVEADEPPPTDVPDYLGVDLGIVNLAVDSDGTSYSGEAVEQKRRVYTHRRHNLQRKQTRAARRKLRALRRRQSRYQRDINHIISKRVVASAKDTRRGIALEDLRGIRSRTEPTVRRRQRARHSNWAFAQLRSCIEYKAKLAGLPVVLVDARNTSRTCLACGHVDKANRPTQACFRCVACGFAGLADHCAARVIAARARAEVMQPNVGGLPTAGKVVAVVSMGRSRERQAPEL